MRLKSLPLIETTVPHRGLFPCSSVLWCRRFRIHRYVAAHILIIEAEVTMSHVYKRQRARSFFRIRFKSKVFVNAMANSFTFVQQRERTFLLQKRVIIQLFVLILGLSVSLQTKCITKSYLDIQGNWCFLASLLPFKVEV